MEVSKNGWWIILLKKFWRLRVKEKEFKKPDEVIPNSKLGNIRNLEQNILLEIISYKTDIVSRKQTFCLLRHSLIFIYITAIVMFLEY